MAKPVQPLAEPELRALFPDAPADLAAPDGVGALFRRRMRAVGGRGRTILLAATAALTLFGVALTVQRSGIGIFVLGFLALAAIIVTIVQYSLAGKDFFRAYAHARGLEQLGSARLDAHVPLLRRGDRRSFGNMMAGTIAGRPTTLGHYTYVEEGHGDNDHDTSFEYTVLHVRLPEPVAARFTGVSLSPRTFSFGAGALVDRLSSDHAVTLESAEFHKRYSLRALDTQDDIALHELFSPPFMLHLATAVDVHFEQRDADLVLWRSGHANRAVDLDRFCTEVQCVIDRYCEEAR